MDTVLVVASMTDTELPFQFVTYTLLLSGLMAANRGPFPTDTVAATESVAVWITETVLALKFATYALVPSALTAKPKGPLPR